MKTTIFVCPFAQFGNPGTAAGAELVADALYEMLDDNRCEDRPLRAVAYMPHVSIVELPLETPDDYAAWRERARELAHRALDEKHFLIWIGGNHLSVLPLYEEIAARSQTMVVQLDAHLDVYHSQDCVPDLSHGNFVRSLNPLPSIFNIGHRDLFLPACEIAEYYQTAISAADFSLDEVKALTDLKKAVKAAKGVFLDIDADVIDPAFFPAVVDVSPFGLYPQQVLKIIAAIDAKKLSALSISEFDPGRDVHDRSMQLLVWLIEHVLLKRYEK